MISVWEYNHRPSIGEVQVSVLYKNWSIWKKTPLMFLCTISEYMITATRTTARKKTKKEARKIVDMLKSDGILMPY